MLLKKRFKKVKIHTSLLIFASILGIMVILTHIYFYINRSSEKMILYTIEELAEHDMHNIETYVSDRWNYMSGYGKELRSRSPETMEELQKELLLKSELMGHAHVGLIDDEGNLYTEQNNVIRAEDNVALEYFSTGKERFVVRCDNEEIFRDIPDEYIMYGFDIREDPLELDALSKRFVGIVVFEDISVIRDRLQIFCFGGDGYTSLLGRHGYYIIPDGSEENITRQVSFADVMRASKIEGYSAEEIIQKVNSNEKVRYWVIDDSGKRKLMMVQPLGDLGWKFIVTIHDSVFKTATQQFVSFIVAVFIILILILSVLLFVIRYIQEKNKKLYFDVVENVYNKKYYKDNLANEEVQALAIIDLDHLKIINDTYGHLVGDWAIKEALLIIGRNVQNLGMVCRLGGDEFLILMYGAVEKETFRIVLENIIEDSHQIHHDSIEEVRLTFSIGGYYGRGVAHELLGKADELLYQAKERRDCLVTNLPGGSASVRAANN